MQADFTPDASRPPHKTRLGCLSAFLTPFFALGLFFLWTGLHNAQQGNTKDGLLVAGFAILFMTVAGLFLVFGIQSHRKNEARLKFQDQNPATPWLWRPEWREGRIRSSDAKSAFLLWIMAVAFLGISLPAVLAIPREWEKGNKPILIALVFPLAGVGLGVAAARATIRTRKFGRSELELHTLPGVIGGTLSGALEIPSKVRAETGFEVRLVCVRRTTSGSGKNRSTHEHVLWEEKKTILKDYLEQATDRTGLPVFFNIPFNQRESQDGNPAIIWRLEVTGQVPGVDYAARFEVPVFKTAESRADAPPAPDPTASFQPPPEMWTPPKGSRILVSETTRGDTQILFPAARNPVVLLGLLAFLAIWTTAVWFMISRKAPLLFPVVFGLFEVLLIIVALQMLFHTVRVIANRSEIEIRHRFLLLRWKSVLPVGDIESIQLKSGMQSGTKVYYDLVLHTRAGRKRGAGGGIPDKKHAEWLASRIRQATGLGQSAAARSQFPTSPFPPL